MTEHRDGQPDDKTTYILVWGTEGFTKTETFDTPGPMMTRAEELKNDPSVLVINGTRAQVKNVLGWVRDAGNV